jgi:hypothetical protein
MSVIWPGLEILIKSYVCHRDKKPVEYRYPFRLHPPDPAFNRGTYNGDLMERVLALYSHLHPKTEVGGRVRLDAVQVRAAIFAVRVTLAFARKKKHDWRRYTPRTKIVLGVDQKSLQTTQRRGGRAIASLERYMKRANRQLRSSTDDDAYRLLAAAWQQHLRWVRLHLVYFKPLPPIFRGKKGRYQDVIDELVEIALRGLRNKSVEPPELRELRRLMRMFAHSARRGREGYHSISYLVQHRHSLDSGRYLACWVRDHSEGKLRNDQTSTEEEVAHERNSTSARDGQTGGRMSNT